VEGARENTYFLPTPGEVGGQGIEKCFVDMNLGEIFGRNMKKRKLQILQSIYCIYLWGKLAP
jgi:hypothetical protein